MALNPGDPFKKCPRCGEDAPLDATVCLKCGRQYSTIFGNQTQAFSAIPQPPPVVMPQPVHIHHHYGQAHGASAGRLIYPRPGHSSQWALILSLVFFSIGGQFYNGQYVKGLVMISVAFVVSFVTFGVALLIWWPVAVVDAYRIGHKLEHGQPVGEWEFF